METTRTLSALWAACALALSCYPPSKQPDSDLLSRQVARWEAAICRKPLVMSMAVLPLKHVRSACRSSLAVGCYRSSDARMIIADDLSDWYTDTVLLHELGHALDDRIDRTHHVAPYTGIMTEIVEEATEGITQADIDMVCNKLSCPCNNPEQIIVLTHGQ